MERLNESTDETVTLTGNNSQSTKKRACSCSSQLVVGALCISKTIAWEILDKSANDINETMPPTERTFEQQSTLKQTIQSEAYTTKGIKTSEQDELSRKVAKVTQSIGLTSIICSCLAVMVIFLYLR